MTPWPEHVSLSAQHFCNRAPLRAYCSGCCQQGPSGQLFDGTRGPLHAAHTTTTRKQAHWQLAAGRAAHATTTSQPPLAHHLIFIYRNKVPRRPHHHTCKAGPLVTSSRPSQAAHATTTPQTPLAHQLIFICLNKVHPRPHHHTCKAGPVVTSSRPSQAAHYHNPTAPSPVAHHLILISLKEVSTGSHHHRLVLIQQPEPLHRQAGVRPAAHQHLTGAQPTQRSTPQHDGRVRDSSLQVWEDGIECGTSGHRQGVHVLGCGVLNGMWGSQHMTQLAAATQSFNVLSFTCIPS
jgi:hypothetical protein